MSEIDSTLKQGRGILVPTVPDGILLDLHVGRFFKALMKANGKALDVEPGIMHPGFNHAVWAQPTDEKPLVAVQATRREDIGLDPAYQADPEARVVSQDERSTEYYKLWVPCMPFFTASNLLTVSSNPGSGTTWEYGTPLSEWPGLVDVPPEPELEQSTEPTPSDELDAFMQRAAAASNLQSIVNRRLLNGVVELLT